jgi:hypothetical protein
VLVVAVCAVVVRVVVGVVVVAVPWAWDERATTSEIVAVAVTAPVISQRLIRLVRDIPASRVLIALFFTPEMLGAGRKKTLSRL